MAVKSKKKRSGILKVATGVVIGAAAAVTATLLSKKKNRQKLVETLKKYKAKSK